MSRSSSNLRGPAIATTNVGTATEFLADGWSTESVSRVLRAARTTQENHEKERAEHSRCTYIQDEMPTFDVFPATSQVLEEGEPPTDKTEPEDEQDEEKAQSLDDTLPIRRWDIRQTVHWFVCFALVAIASRSPNSYVLNDVVGFDLFFRNTFERHTKPAMNIVCWSTGLRRAVPLRDKSGETMRTACRNT